ncbi:hypothetical protein C7B77_22730 [Chamaesiphon polymorphus CCALA 037]|uniref:Uncharacterized protein n=1 Tax=Chamaesiphon polymorphus CCALA 037 TaxID=2107692 RepID=A0A2T1FZN9_9CYAN|nr:hypothetical protein C7B77_22730 [Chamaesiphon polymorphus CCALA 037]
MMAVGVSGVGRGGLGVGGWGLGVGSWELGVSGVMNIIVAQNKRSDLKSATPNETRSLNPQLSIIN